MSDEKYKGFSILLQEYEVFFGSHWQMFVWATSEESAKEIAIDAFVDGLCVEPTENFKTEWVDD